MVLKEIVVENFRLLKNFKLELKEDLSLIIGKNNCGKTSVLVILDKMLNSSEIAWEDVNLVKQKELYNEIKGFNGSVQDGNKFLEAIKLQLYIEDSDIDSYENIQNFIMDLDPENNIILLEFISLINIKNILELKDIIKGRKIKDFSTFSRYMSKNFTKYFKIKKYSRCYDKKTKKIISDIFYNFGVTGLKIEEPILNKDPLNFYKDEKQFLISENSVSAYFPLNIYSEKRKKVLEETFAEKFSEDENIVYNLDFYEYDEEDYQNSWKKYLFVEKVSEKFVVKPTWREYEKQDNELVIELDPGRAFGTGSHPTTSLLLKLMEKQDFSNKSVIDIGTGSGILMIAGKFLGAGEVYGTDIDEFSMEVAKENLILNNISLNDVKLLKGNLLEVIENKKFDIVVCNILADVLVKLLDEIKYILKENSIVLFSGIIEDKLNEVISKAEDVGLEVVEIKADKEWRAVYFKRK